MVGRIDNMMIKVKADNRKFKRSVKSIYRDFNNGQENTNKTDYDELLMKEEMEITDSVKSEEQMTDKEKERSEGQKYNEVRRREEWKGR